jgi:hypothetical protein
MPAVLRASSRVSETIEPCHETSTIHLVTFQPPAAQTRKPPDMKCEEMLAVLNDYVDGTIDPAICEEFEKHMAGCDPCQVVVDNIRQTITLYKNGQPYDLPVQFREQLHEALRRRWKEKFAAK